MTGTAASSLTPQQAAEERSVLVAIVLDVAISAVFTVTGLLGACLSNAFLLDGRIGS